MFNVSDSQSFDRSARSHVRRIAAALVLGLALTIMTAFAAPLLGDEVAEYVGGVSVVQAEECQGGGSC